MTRRFNERRLNRLVGKIARHRHAHPENFAGRERLYIKHVEMSNRLTCGGVIMFLLLTEVIK